MLVKVKFANIINITAGEEVIPELLQSKCNSKEIFSVVDKLLTDQHALEKQIIKSQKIIKDFTYRCRSVLIIFDHLNKKISRINT